MRRLRVATLILHVFAASVLVAAPARAESLLLTFVGDIMHHDSNARMANYDILYDAVRDNLQSDDLSFANIEFPVDASREPSGYPLFNGSLEYVQAAVRGGFDVFSLANNHSFDWGVESAAATGGVFESLAVTTGTYHNGLRDRPGAQITPTTIHHNGWSIGFVSITALSNTPGSARFINLVNYTNDSVAGAFLRQVSQWDLEYDLLIVGVHAGTEYVTQPNGEKARFFRDLVAHGADIVWGHHPHVLQPWETVHVGASNKIIMHSTGNFISGQRRLQQPSLPLGRWAPTGDTALYRVTVSRSPSVDSSGRIQPTVVRVSTPMYTAHDDPANGLIPKTFGSVLTQPLPLVWRAFYSARYAATRALLDAPLESLTVRPVHESRP
jgi:capsule synthesis protein PGA_cap